MAVINTCPWQDVLALPADHTTVTLEEYGQSVPPPATQVHCGPTTVQVHAQENTTPAVAPGTTIHVGTTLTGSPPVGSLTGSTSPPNSHAASVSFDGDSQGHLDIRLMSVGDVQWLDETGYPGNGVLDNVQDSGTKPNVLAGGDVEAVTNYINNQETFSLQQYQPQYTTVVWVSVKPSEPSDWYLTDADYCASTGAYDISVIDSTTDTWTTVGRGVLFLKQIRRSWFRQANVYIDPNTDEPEYVLSPTGYYYIVLTGWNATAVYHAAQIMNDGSNSGPILPTEARLQFMLDVLTSLKASTDPKPAKLDKMIEGVERALDNVKDAGYWH